MSMLKEVNAHPNDLHAMLQAMALKSVFSCVSQSFFAAGFFFSLGFHHRSLLCRDFSSRLQGQDIATKRRSPRLANKSPQKDPNSTSEKERV
jgi:hypothetical protein